MTLPTLIPVSKTRWRLLNYNSRKYYVNQVGVPSVNHVNAIVDGDLSDDSSVSGDPQNENENEPVDLYDDREAD